MRVDDDGVNVIERYAANLFPVPLDDEEPAVDGKMLPVCGDINDPVHPPYSPYSRGPGSNTRPSGSMRTWRAFIFLRLPPDA